METTKSKRDPRISTYVTGTGLKKYRVRFKRTIHNQKISFEKQGFDKFAEAVAWADDTLRQAKLRNGQVKNPTVREYCDVFLQRRFNKHHNSTYAKYKHHFEEFLLPVFGDRQMKDITRMEFQDFLDSLVTKKRQRSAKNGEDGYSISTIRSIRGSIMTLFNEAVYDEVILVNKVGGAHTPKDTQHPKQEIKMTRQEYQRVIDVTDGLLGPIDRAIVYGALLGMRHGEVMGLQMQDLYMDHLSVNSQINTMGERGPLKTDSSYRDVHITPKVYNVMDAARTESIRIRKTKRIGYTRESSMFVNQRGTDASYGYMQKLFRNLSELVGFKVHPHLLRHAFATFAMPYTTDRLNISRILGHKNVQMTEYYDMGDEEDSNRIIDRMDAFK